MMLAVSASFSWMNTDFPVRKKLTSISHAARAKKYRHLRSYPAGVAGGSTRRKIRAMLAGGTSCSGSEPKLNRNARVPREAGRHFARALRGLRIGFRELRVRACAALVLQDLPQVVEVDWFSAMQIEAQFVRALTMLVSRVAGHRNQDSVIED
jgi:hypothetical protein